MHNQTVVRTNQRGVVVFLLSLVLLTAASLAARAVAADADRPTVESAGATRADSARLVSGDGSHLRHVIDGTVAGGVSF